MPNRDDLQPDMTPGACTHMFMIRRVDASGWDCADCDLTVGTDDHGRSLSPIHPLWPAETVPA